MAKKEADKRNYLIDNCRALLIILVVVGHLLAKGPRDHSDFWLSSWMIIYVFHMPFFFFLSGLFAKTDTLSTTKSSLRLLVLYIEMTLLVSLTSTLALGKAFQPSFFVPVFSAWFLLALLIMRLLLPVLANVRYIVPLSILLALVIPVSDKVGTFLSLARMFYFLPFFLIGAKIGLSGVYAFRKRFALTRHKIVLAFFGSLALASIVVLAHNGIVTKELLWANTSYADIGIKAAVWQIAALRLYVTVAAILVSAALLAIMPDRKILISYFGQNSLSVYILQAVFIKLFPHILGFSAFITGWIYLAIAFMFCLIAALPIFNKILSFPADTAVYYLTSNSDNKAKTTTRVF